MPVSAQVLAAIAAGAHILFFLLESVFFMRPGVHRTFGAATAEEAGLLRGIFLNQGFYNLFLAVGVIWGLIASARWTPVDELKAIVNGGAASDRSLEGARSLSDAIAAGNWGEPVVVFGLACMVGAAVVLLVSSGGRMLRGALIQGLAPAAALLILALT